MCCGYSSCEPLLVFLTLMFTLPLGQEKLSPRPSCWRPVPLRHGADVPAGGGDAGGGPAAQPHALWPRSQTVSSLPALCLWSRKNNAWLYWMCFAMGLGETPRHYQCYAIQVCGNLATVVFSHNSRNNMFFAWISTSGSGLARQLLLEPALHSCNWHFFASLLAKTFCQSYFWEANWIVKSLERVWANCSPLGF